MATVEQLNRASEKKLLAGLLLELEIQLEEARWQRFVCTDAFTKTIGIDATVDYYM